MAQIYLSAVTYYTIVDSVSAVHIMAFPECVVDMHKSIYKTLCGAISSSDEGWGGWEEGEEKFLLEDVSCEVCKRSYDERSKKYNEYWEQEMK